jgi:hypothetical protein
MIPANTRSYPVSPAIHLMPDLGESGAKGETRARNGRKLIFDGHCSEARLQYPNLCPHKLALSVTFSALVEALTPALTFGLRCRPFPILLQRL